MNGFIFIVRRRRVGAFQINDSRRQIGSAFIEDGNFFRENIIRMSFALRSFGGNVVVCKKTKVRLVRLVGSVGWFGWLP